jgi:hypothetical protein
MLSSAEFYQRLLIDAVKSGVVRYSAFKNLFAIIDVFRINHQVDALVKGRHVVVGAETIGNKGH